MSPELPKNNDLRSESRDMNSGFFDSEPTTFELPITFLDRNRAAELTLNCDREDQAEQLYLNALATLAVAQYCKYVGLVPNLDRSQLWNTIDFSQFSAQEIRDYHNIADLTLADGRCLECRPYWAGQSEVFVPHASWRKRDGFLAIEISEELDQAKITGFLTSVSREFIPVTEWSDLKAFFEVLLPTPETETSPAEIGTNRLDDWFSGLMRSGWQALSEIETQLGWSQPEFTPSFRSPRDQSDNAEQASGQGARQASEDTLVQAKLLKFPDIAEIETDHDRQPGTHEPIPTNPNPVRTSIDPAPATASILLGLCVKTRKLREGLREVWLQVVPPANCQTLPKALTLSLLDASGDVINHAKPKGGDSFGFRLAVELGEHFSIRIALGGTEYTEHFLG
jgi:hypothetical protein